jgi:type VI secretion system secreted protein Hcp
MSMKRRYLRGLFTSSIFAAGLLVSSPAMAAVDMFLKMDNIQGESTDKNHPGEMNVLAWSWGESAGTARTRRGTVAPACIQDLSLTKYVDSSSPQLIMNDVLGTIAQTAVLTLQRSGDKPVEFLRITMKNVTVASYQTGGSSGEDRIVDNIVLHFESMQGEYRQQKPDGTLGTPILFELANTNSRGCQ